MAGDGGGEMVRINEREQEYIQVKSQQKTRNMQMEVLEQE